MAALVHEQKKCTFLDAKLVFRQLQNRELEDVCVRERVWEGGRWEEGKGGAPLRQRGE